MGTTQQEVPLELFAIEVFTPDDPCDRWIHASRLYPTRHSAESAMALLKVEAGIREQEDWEKQPCVCGKRNCDDRAYLFPNFSIQVLKLAS